MSMTVGRVTPIPGPGPESRLYAARRRPRIFMVGQKHFALDVARALEPIADMVGGSAPEGDRFGAYVDAVAPPAVDWRDFGPGSVPDDVDLIIAAHAHVRISEAVRDRARHGAMGYHPSLLPLHRGIDSIRWAIENGDRVTGGSAYMMDDGWDTGPVVLQDWCFVRPGDTAAALWRRDLAPMGVDLLRQAVHDLRVRGDIVSYDQDDDLATFEPGWKRRTLMAGEDLWREPVAGTPKPTE